MVGSYFLLNVFGLSLVSGAKSWSSSQQVPCRYIPGDEGYPVRERWDKLNATVGGRLIATAPVAGVCHGEAYNEDQCNALKKVWDFPQPHLYESGEIMNPYWQNQSCDPFTPQSTSCALGNYVSYAIAVNGPDDVQAGIRFAEENNVRLVMKNTGHDYLGRSTGRGALGLWMQSLKSADVIQDYTSSHYSGPAMKVGAGVLSADAYAAAHKYGLRVVGGGCPSVGIAGGYTQGGGHSILTSSYGLSADNVLEWEVVTAAGEHIIATPSEHADLYWALSGGGGGNYAVVLSMTIRAFQDGPVGGTYLSFNASEIGLDLFWEAMETFQALVPSIADKGAGGLYMVADGRFVLLSLTAPGLTRDDIVNLLSPILTWLDDHKTSYVFRPSYFDSFLEHFTATFGPLPYGPLPVSDVVSSRLIPRSVITDHPSKAIQTFRNIVEGQTYYLGMALLNANNTGLTHPKNAVLPAWRSALIQCIVGTAWDWSIPREDMLERNRKLVEEIVPALVALTPGSGTYVNEGNVNYINWQHEFYGENYGKLLEIKKRYDPHGLFYAAAAVGSEKWTTDADGRVCLSAGDGKDGINESQLRYDEL